MIPSLHHLDLAESLTYDQLEERKADAWTRFHGATTDAERADALEAVAECHYLRSLSRAVRGGWSALHPDLARYLRAYDVPNVVTPEFRRRHPLQRSPHLPAGTSWWERRR